MQMNQDVILRVLNFSIGIKDGKRIHTAVDRISFQVNRGEILGIVGESGCGKSITALSVLGLLGEGVKVTDGQLLFDGNDLLLLPKRERQKINGKDISIIFQEPMTSLNPLIKIGQQIGEVLKIHESRSKKEIQDAVKGVLAEVGFVDPEKIMASYPHQLSGGMRQRVMIAMAIIGKPKLLIADEPTTALDVTTQAQVLELLKKINRKYHTTILFISHDLGVIKRLCDRVLVMYAGKIVEQGRTSTILIHPVHEYTKGLMNSIPTRKKKGELLCSIKGKVPPVTEKKSPCPFAPRCDAAKDICFQTTPEEKYLSEHHSVSCHMVDADGESEYYRI
ncbi:MAG: ABC transporter ATP-binding protein [Roseburia sp.]